MVIGLRCALRCWKPILGPCNLGCSRSELTRIMLRRIKNPVLKLLHHLLCLGILLGVAGNGVAVAAPCILMAQSQPAAMADMPDCAMGASCPDCGARVADHGKTGKEQAPGCMTMAGCTAMLAMKEPAAPVADRRQTAATVFWPAAAILAGHDTAPEPEPPTFLG